MLFQLRSLRNVFWSEFLFWFFQLSYYRSQAEMAHTCRGTISLHGAHIQTEDSCNFIVSNGGGTQVKWQGFKPQWLSLQLPVLSAVPKAIGEFEAPFTYMGIDFIPVLQGILLLRIPLTRLYYINGVYNRESYSLIRSSSRHFTWGLPLRWSGNAGSRP